MVEVLYGYFPGGGFDPRGFEPDREVNTPDEIRAWQEACCAWNQGTMVARFEQSG